MPVSFAPFGLRAIAAFGSHGNELRAYPLPNGSACPNLGKGSPVKLNAGVVTSIGASGNGPLLGVAGARRLHDAIERIDSLTDVGELVRASARS